MKRLRVSFICAALIVLCLAPDARAQSEPAHLALKGYDPVAYFTDQRAMRGGAQYEYERDGALYRFVSAEHREMFKRDPDRYLPQFEGWCAASVAKGEKIHGNPEWWLVFDDRLYLFGKPIGPGLMSADPATMQFQAEGNWPQVSQQPSPPLPDYMRTTAEAK
jgi:YHS domain-containing protein